MLAQLTSGSGDSVRADGFGHAGAEFVAEHQGKKLAKNGMTGQPVYITSVAQKERGNRPQAGSWKVDRWRNRVRRDSGGRTESGQLRLQTGKHKQRMEEAQLRWMSFSETQSEIANGRKESERWRGPAQQTRNKPRKEQFNPIYRDLGG